MYYYAVLVCGKQNNAFVSLEKRQNKNIHMCEKSLPLICYFLDIKSFKIHPRSLFAMLLIEKVL